MSFTKEQIRKAKEEKWFRGDLSFKLHSAQKVIDQTFKDTSRQLFVGNCSRQFGKSYWAVCKAIEQAIKKPKSQVRYGAAFHSDLIEFIIPAFDKVLEDCPESIKGKYTKQGSCFTFPNGSKIKLVGLDKNPNGLRGNTLDLIILDECGFVSNLDYVYKSVIIPATTHRPDAKIILISTPPATPAHPFLDYAHRAELENSYAMFTIYDNPMVDEATIQRLMQESGGEKSTTWRREYLCEFITDADLAIISEWKDEFVQEVEPDEFYKYYHKYVGMDLGVKDFTACIFGYYDFKKASLIIEDELHMNGPSMNTELLVNAIKSKEKEIWKELTPFRRVSDNNWPILMQDFSSIHNLTFIATNKDSLEAMINEVRLMVQAGQIIVNPRCKQLIGCLKYGVWDSKKKAFARSTTYGHFDHLAALIYLVRNLAKLSNPIPVDHGFQNHTAWLGNIKDQRNTSKNARTIANALMPKKKEII
jgi:hypothetical protein